MGTDNKGHRAGSLKQTNKKHKTGRHRSKGAIDNDQKGLFTISVQSYFSFDWALEFWIENVEYCPILIT